MDLGRHHETAPRRDRLTGGCSFTATGSSAVLSFQSTDPPTSGCGALITDVTATPVAGTPLLNPLVGAATLVVLAPGGGVVYFLRRRRQESATA